MRSKMRNIFSKFISLTVFSAAWTACAKMESGEVLYDQDGFSISTVQVSEVLPDVDTLNVATDSEVRIKFTDRINTSSVQYGITFRVEEANTGRLLPGVFVTENNDTIRWKHSWENFDMQLEAGTTYLVKTDFIRDDHGSTIGAFWSRFRTKKTAENTGTFRVARISGQRPDDLVGDDIDNDYKIIAPNHAIDIEFTEPILIPASIRQTASRTSIQYCDPTYWSDAIQIHVVDPFNPEGVVDFNNAKGTICRVCRRPSNSSDQICDKLRFVPSTPWPEESVLSVEVRPTENLKSSFNRALAVKKSQELFVLWGSW